MFIDASALTAILTDENDAHQLLTRMQQDQIRLTSPLAIWETTLAVARILGLSAGDAEAAIEAFLSLAQITVLPVPAEAYKIANDAFQRYGKGRHPAALNFGDCFAYACARHAGTALLYKGNDFPQTDIETA